MSTSDERRQAACDLRHYANEHSGVGILDDFKRAVGMAGMSWSDTMLRIADLIDPQCRSASDALKFTDDDGDVLGMPYYRCSECGSIIDPTYEKYCDGCGSRIVGGDGVNIWEK